MTSHVYMYAYISMRRHFAEAALELVHFLLNQAFVGAVLGAVWTFFKTSDWFERLRTRRIAKAIRALEAAVDQTYRVYVRQIKEGREDGKLTDAERRHAHRMARRAAIEFGKQEGVDVLRTLGHDYLDLWISKIVKRLKRQ